MNWRQQAACRGWPIDVFVPEQPPVSPPPIVQSLCRSCPVAGLCEAYGRSTGSSGWWGGKFLVCGVERSRRTIDRRCIVCTAGFQATHARAMFCSPRCQRVVSEARRDGTQLVLLAPLPSTVDLVCVICGAAFVGKRADVWYCSRECARVTQFVSKVRVSVMLSFTVEVAA